MTPRFICRIAAATALFCFASTAAARQQHPSVINVAPPASNVETDRASIIAALERARPGDTVQFEPGTYLVGRLIPVATSRLTLRGHADGTVLRGCEPADYDAMSREFVGLLAAPPDPANPGAAWDVVSRCGMLELTGGHVTIRNFTFEYGRLGLLLGCCGAERAFRATDGGYLIEDNTFRNSGNSVRAILSSPARTVIRNNRFINTFHALSAVGSQLHFVDNHVAVTDPAEVPGGMPGFGVSIGSIPPDVSTDLAAGACDGNIIARNHVEGHPNGIFLNAGAGSTCTGAEIRDNTIIVRRGPYRASWPYAPLVPLDHPSDSTIVGVPLTLWGESGDGVADGRVTNSLVEGNRIAGAEGVGMELRGATRNRILNNTISGVLRRDPYPGNVDGPPPQWGDEHNGSGIWVSPGSDGNEIVGNTFEGIAGAAVVLRGDGNVVELVRSPSDAVRDHGTGNRVSTSRREQQ
jgi:parallel beta-helix repeat protein